MTRTAKTAPMPLGQKGATAVLVALLLPVLFGIVALAVDVGYVFATRNELQNVADAAALAGAGELGAIYSPLSYEEQQGYVVDPASIKDLVHQIVAENHAAGLSPTIQDGDISIGTWDFNETPGNQFSPTLTQPNAVRVIARRDSLANGPIITFFAKIFHLFGADDAEIISLTAEATAALNGQGIANEGDIPIPIGMPAFLFDPDQEFCGQEIKFSPPTDTDSCGGWTDFGTDPSVTPKPIIDFINGTTPSPELRALESQVTFNNGTLNTHVFETALERFQNEGYDMGYENGLDDAGKPRKDQDGNPVGPEVDLSAYDIGAARPFEVDGVQLNYPPCNGTNDNCSGPPRYHREWTTTVLVYDEPTCAPNDTYTIVGFAEVTITDVRLPPDNLLIGKIKCDYVDQIPTPGGGGTYGTLGSIPGLVQ